MVRWEAAAHPPVFRWGFPACLCDGTVNVYHTGEMLSFGCAMTITLCSHTDASGVLLSSGWKLAIYGKNYC